MELEQIKLNLLRLDYLMGAAIVVTQLFHIPALTSLFFYGTFFVSLTLWVCTLMEQVSALDLLAMIISFLAFTCVVTNGIFSNAAFSFEYMKKYIMFCCSIIFFAAVMKTKIDEYTEYFLGWLFWCVGGILCVMYVAQNAQMHILNGQYTNYLTFRFTNPNMTALFLVCMSLFLVVVGVGKKRIVTKLLFFLMAGVEFIFLYQTLSRNALLAVGVFLVFLLVLFLLQKKDRIIVIPQGILALCAVFPMIFAELYLQVVYNPTIMRALSFIVEEGKKLDSRVRIWKEAFGHFRNSPLLGAYYQISNGTGMSQLHNTHIDILTSYGIIVFLLTCIFLWQLMVVVQKNNSHYMQVVALVGFIAALFLGLGEAALFSGGLGIYLYVGIFLVMANRQEKK